MESRKNLCVAQSKTPSTLQRSDSLRPTLSTFPFCAFFSGRKTRASVLFACAFTVKTHVPRLFEIFSRKNNSFRRYLETKILLSFFLLLFFISKNKTWRRFERSLCKINQFKKGREISLFFKHLRKFSANFDNSDYFWRELKFFFKLKPKPRDRSINNRKLNNCENKRKNYITAYLIIKQSWPRIIALKLDQNPIKSNHLVQNYHWKRKKR